MNLLLNIVLGVLAFAVARYAFALLNFDGAIGWLLAVVVGVVVFFQNYAAKFNR